MISSMIVRTKNKLVLFLLHKKFVMLLHFINERRCNTAVIEWKKNFFQHKRTFVIAIWKKSLWSASWKLWCCLQHIRIPAKTKVSFDKTWNTKLSTLKFLTRWLYLGAVLSHIHFVANETFIFLESLFQKVQVCTEFWNLAPDKKLHSKIVSQSFQKGQSLNTEHNTQSWSESWRVTRWQVSIVFTLLWTSKTGGWNRSVFTFCVQCKTT